MSDMQILPPTRAMIGRWDVERYISLLRKWSILASLIVALFVFSQQPRSLVIGWECLAAIAIGWLVAKRNGGKIESLAAGAFIGVSLGVVATLSRFVLNPTLANGLLVLIETVLTTVVAALITVSTVIILNLIHQPKN